MSARRLSVRGSSAQRLARPGASSSETYKRSPDAASVIRAPLCPDSCRCAASRLLLANLAECHATAQRSGSTCRVGQRRGVTQMTRAHRVRTHTRASLRRTSRAPDAPVNPSSGASARVLNFSRCSSPDGGRPCPPPYITGTVRRRILYCIVDAATESGRLKVTLVVEVGNNLTH